MIQVILPYSRHDLGQKTIKALAELHKPEDTRLLIIVDGVSIPTFEDNLGFEKITVIVTGLPKAKGSEERRERIAWIHNRAKELVPDCATHVLLVEDDTTFDPDALKKLLETMEDQNTDLVAGIEIARHGNNHVGAYVQHEGGSIVSIMPNVGWDYSTVTGTGLYFTLIKTELYKSHTFEQYNKDNAQGLSCDFNFGSWITKNGGKCLVDWRVNCKHWKNTHEYVDINNTKLMQIVFEKTNSGWHSRLGIA